MNKLRKIVITFSILTFAFIFLKNTTTIADADSPQVEKVDNYDDLSSELSNLIEENQVKQPSNSKYSSKRLIVKSKTDNLNLADLGAKNIISGPDNLYFLQFDSEESTKDAFEKLNSNVKVKYVEPDIELEVESTQSSNSINESTLSNTSFNSWGVKRLQIDKYVNSLPNKSREITVGVVDSGIVSHPFLKNRVLSNGWDFLDNDNTPNDLNGHGTAMAGVLVDCTPNLNLKILPVKTFNSDGKGSTSNIALGIRYAVDNGADVLNLSFGGVHHSFLHDAVEYALKNNVVVVTSAGNDSENVSYSCPADMDSVIVTSASDQSDEIAYFSNYGNTVDVAAPGYEILTCSYKGGYTEENGTSLSAPHISAIAALIKLADPNITPAKVESLIISSSEDFGEKGWDKYYGHGIPNMSKALVYQKITLNKSSINLTTSNSSFKLISTLYPYHVLDKNITWSSSNENIAKVDSNGTVTGIAPGKATITAKTSNNLIAKCSVTVSDFLISLNKTYITLDKGNTTNLKATITPSDYASKKITWTSSNQNIATVDSSGNVKGVNAGEATITAKLDNDMVDTCKIKVSQNVNKLKYKSISSQVYTGSSIKPSLGELYSSNTELVKGVDYKIEYINNRSIGTASIKITGLGNYYGEHIIKFKIIPKAVSSFKAESYTTSQLTLSCKPVRGSYGYAIYRYNFKEKEYDKIATVKENPKSSSVRFTDKNRASGTIYNYRIKVIKKVNNEYYYGAYSKTRVVTKLYKPSVTLKSSKSNVNMSWKKVNRATKYKIYRATSKNGKYHYIGYSNKTTYTDKKLTKKKTYYYKVRAVRTDNKKDYYGDYSTIKSIKVN
ncbi:S8 family serine peptidase [Terrisporobacter petrolearius]|uniref:S8 family serine peptidase n=1 Tax=Terrisporobacter petrolearius TaxID=1460447 RepID=UPI0031CC4EA2